MSKTTTVKKDVKKEEVKPIPANAEILNSNITTDVEQIENGYLITKRVETKYREKGKDFSDWHYETRKWYSEEDPLEIKTGDKGLADAFKE